MFIAIEMFKTLGPVHSMNHLLQFYPTQTFKLNFLCQLLYCRELHQIRYYWIILLEYLGNSIFNILALWLSGQRDFLEGVDRGFKSKFFCLLILSFDFVRTRRSYEPSFYNCTEYQHIK